MKFGIFTIYAALIATAYSGWFYLQAGRQEGLAGENFNSDKLRGFLRKGRMGFYGMTLLVSAASIYLWYLILSHQFQVDYVYRYTSLDLGVGYLISAFWAGQEGSFLFWALMTAFVGVLYLYRSSRFEAWSMLVLTVIQASFLILLIKAGPFTLMATAPADGAGLNPLLQNPWMVIHPPILFMGYAATALPFAIAIAALIKRDFKGWVEMAIPWTLFASITMGAGIIIGGYWAYKVLGWGGYWGWDPVENSSLIAWLVVLALFHGLLVTRYRGGLQKTNFALAISGFVLVLYATFLTRSGVLADFSVHSFQDLGINGLLTLYQLAALFLGLGLLILRRNEIPYSRIQLTGITKENILAASVLIFVSSAFFILLGTSSPLITSLFGSPAQVDISFYNRVNLPIAMLLALAMGLAPVLSWVDEKAEVIAGRLILSAVTAVAGVAAAVYFGMTGSMLILFLALCLFALTSNLQNLFQKARLGWKIIVAPLAHIGVALMFLGIIVSGVFEKVERTVLTQNVPGNILGYDFTFTGDYRSEDGKHGLHIEVRDGDRKYEAIPRLYMNKYFNSEMREPHVREGLASDLYISPLRVIDDGKNNGGDELLLKKGETKQYAGYKIMFTSFNLSNHEDAGGFKVSAMLRFEKEGDTYEAAPALLIKGRENINQPAVLSWIKDETGREARVALSGINAEKKNIKLTFQGLGAGKSNPQRIAVEISTKPFMSVLWLGTIILTLATIMAMKRRSSEHKLYFMHEG